MSIPIDKLYHYIESVAKEIYNDIIIYRFYPHGSKKLSDLTSLWEYDTIDSTIIPQLYCNDQEPLDYSFYDVESKNTPRYGKHLTNKYNVSGVDRNFIKHGTIYDHCLLLHSEQRSENVELYKQHRYIPVYYWSHGIIALDWFRYAQYEKLNKNIKKIFLIYNRAWSGTREYRLKFIDLLIDNNLVEHSQCYLNPVEPELGYHYKDHQYRNNVWRPNNQLENYFSPTTAHSSASADYEINDYNATEFEVVLETLFDDERIQLTEKILRPVALGQPFLLVSTHGCLEYLRSYGFRTFASVIDESYDLIEDPVARLESIVKAMREIANWDKHERTEKMTVIKQIADYNRKHFFSNKFFNQLTEELKTNLKSGLDKLENTNTAAVFINLRKELSKFEEGKRYLITYNNRQNLVKILTRAREYYNKR